MATLPEEGGSIVQQACAILKCNTSVMNISVMNVGQQVGGTDCGVFAIAMATDLCFGVDPVSVKYVQEGLRSHLESCFESQQISRFPSLSRPVASRIHQTVSIEIHCLCHQPEGTGLMVGCDNCGIWFHAACVQECSDDLDSCDEWLCPSCKCKSLLSTKLT